MLSWPLVISLQLRGLHQPLCGLPLTLGCYVSSPWWDPCRVHLHAVHLVQPGHTGDALCFSVRSMCFWLVSCSGLDPGFAPVTHVLLLVPSVGLSRGGGNYKKYRGLGWCLSWWEYLRTWFQIPKTQLWPHVCLWPCTGGVKAPRQENC